MTTELLQKFAGAYVLFCYLLLIAGTIYFGLRIISNTLGYRSISPGQSRRELFFAAVCGAAIVIVLAIIYFSGVD